MCSLRAIPVPYTFQGRVGVGSPGGSPSLLCTIRTLLLLLHFTRGWLWSQHPQSPPPHSVSCGGGVSRCSVQNKSKHLFIVSSLYNMISHLNFLRLTSPCFYNRLMHLPVCNVSRVLVTHRWKASTVPRPPYLLAGAALGISPAPSTGRREGREPLPDHAGLATGQAKAREGKRCSHRGREVECHLASSRTTSCSG